MAKHVVSRRPWGKGRGWWACLEVPDTADEPMTDTLVAAFRDGRISEYQLWDVCTHHLSPVPGKVAVQVFAQLGFIWGKGWPLQREGGLKWESYTI